MTADIGQLRCLETKEGQINSSLLANLTLTTDSSNTAYPSTQTHGHFPQFQRGNLLSKTCNILVVSKSAPFAMTPRQGEERLAHATIDLHVHLAKTSSGGDDSHSRADCIRFGVANEAGRALEIQNSSRMFLSTRRLVSSLKFYSHNRVA